VRGPVLRDWGRSEVGFADWGLIDALPRSSASFLAA
jgi:hypothetical protein